MPWMNQRCLFSASLTTALVLMPIFGQDPLHVLIPRDSLFLTRRARKYHVSHLIDLFSVELFFKQNPCVKVRYGGTVVLISLQSDHLAFHSYLTSLLFLTNVSPCLVICFFVNHA